ncbi:MAG: hypothetical protein Q8J89_11385 [Caulobacter sp.]|nr:hypothetical protein [Caulobacter sp.]
MSIWLAAAMSAAMFAQPAPPATPPAEDGTTVDSLVVTARPAPEKEVIAAFVATIADETGNDRLGRWDRKICPGVVGLRADYARLLVDRIAETAVEIGLEVGEPGCKANMIVLATAESDKLANSMVKDYPEAFAKFDSGIRPSRRALKAFTTSKAAVRWWHVIARTTADGQRYQKGDQVRVRDVGRLRGGTRDDFDRVIIIMDASRIGTLRFASLADYIAMVGLAQVDPEAEITGVSSVLNLFADRAAGVEPPERMTDWDRAYLKGLYAARRDVRRGDAQEKDIARSMVDDLATPAEPGKD